MTFPPRHRTKPHSTNPIEHLNSGIKRLTEVVGIFPNKDARSYLNRTAKWAVQRTRYMTVETIVPLNDDPSVSLPVIAG